MDVYYNMNLNCFKAYDSGEVPSRVEDVPATIERLLMHFAPLNPRVDRPGGISLAFSDWRSICAGPIPNRCCG